MRLGCLDVRLKLLHKLVITIFIYFLLIFGVKATRCYCHHCYFQYICTNRMWGREVDKLEGVFRTIETDGIIYAKLTEILDNPKVALKSRHISSRRCGSFQTRRCRPLSVAKP